MSVTKSIAKRLPNYGTLIAFGYKLRAKRIVSLLKMIELVSNENGNVNIIDIGGLKYIGI